MRTVVAVPLHAAVPWNPDAYLAENLSDVRVVAMELPATVHACVDHAQRLIWLDRAMTHAERRSALAYEIGQLLQGPTPDDPCVARARELAAADWAARMLIPMDAMIDAFTDLWQLPGIAARLDVDTPTLRARLRGMTDDEQDALMLWTRGASSKVI